MTFDPTSAPTFAAAEPLPDSLRHAPAPVAAPVTAPPPSAGAFDLLADVEIEVTVEFGRRRLPLGEVARLEVGSVIELDALAGEPLAIFANGRRIATGEAVVVDGQFAVRIESLAR